MLNLLVVMIDCLRQDRLEGPGKTAITPHLDAVRARSTAFDNIHCVGSNTTAVMGSWFTGLYPYKHGLRSFRDRRFDGDPMTLARTLKAQGYRTVTTVTEALADAQDMLDGFDEIERRDKKLEAIYDGYGARARATLATLNRSARPWFYFIHTCELHADRQCHPHFRKRRYGRDFYDRSLSSVDHYLGAILDVVDWDDTIVVVFGDHGDNLLWEPKGELASKVMNRLRGDGRVSALWWLRDAFYKLGLYGPWKAVLRHNVLYHHDYHVYRFLTQAPLMLIAPGQTEGRRIDAAMSSVDVMPTLLDLLGIAAPDPLDGISFAPMLRGGSAPSPSRPLYQEVVTDFVLKGRDPSKLRIPLLRALVEDNWKLVGSALDRAIKPELYDLATDPDETRNLYPLERGTPLVQRLERLLEAIEPGPPRAASAMAGALAAPGGGAATPWH
jgi:arylsulfatase A-like enzyme